MSDSPAEYIEQLRAENRALRRGLIDIVREKQALEEAVAALHWQLKEAYKRYFRVERELTAAPFGDL